jgi:hypothetical protein
MAPIALDVQNLGLYTHPNPLALPPGAMIRALNVVIDKENVVESARGSKAFGVAVASELKKLFGYKDRVLAHYGSTLAYFSADGLTRTDYAGTYAAPSGAKMKSMLANRNFYFTTSSGIKKLDQLAGTVTDAGGIKALDGTAALSGASGFMATNTQVAYRVVWGYKDANQNLILGSPSQRITLANAAGASRDAAITFTVPDGVTTSHFYQIYRSAQSATSATEANDDLQLVIEKNPTSGEVSAKLVTVTDSTPDSLRGASLYTNPGQQGIAQANEPPPLARDMTNFKGMALYANTETRWRIRINLLSVGVTSLNFYDVTGDISIGTDTILNVSSTTGLAIGQLITGTGIPAATRVTNIVGTTVTMSANATATTLGLAIRFRDRLTLDGVDFWANSAEDVANKYFEIFTGGTTAQNIADTSRSIVKIINRQTSGVNIYGYYLSGFDDLPGQMLIEDRTLGGSVWYVTSTKGTSFSPEFAETGTGDASSNEAKKNGIAISKNDQPEAVPLLNNVFAGSADHDILRVMATRDSAFVLKTDGLFRVTGDTPSNIQVTPFDATVILLGEETAVLMNNQIYAYTSQGVVSISDGGAQVVSRKIEKDLLKIFSDLYPTAETVAFGVGYESERKYLLWTVKDTGDTVAKQAWVYNSFTNSWTRWEKTLTCGFVNPYDDRLYMGHGTTNIVRQERKSFTVEDYAEDEYSVTIAAFSGTSVTLNSTASAAVGQTLGQAVGSAYNQAKVTAIVDATNVTVDRTVQWNLAAAKLYDPIPIELEWAPIHGGAPGVVKRFPEVTLFFREANFRSVQLLVASNFSFSSSPATLMPVSTAIWGIGPWGLFPWGGGPPPVQPIRTYIPLEQQRANWINLSIEHAEALTSLAMAGFSNPLEPSGTRFH